MILGALNVYYGNGRRDGEESMPQQQTNAASAKRENPRSASSRVFPVSDACGESSLLVQSDRVL